jgi:hypothetical protein
MEQGQSQIIVIASDLFQSGRKARDESDEITGGNSVFLKFFYKTAKIRRFAVIICSFCRVKTQGTFKSFNSGIAIILPDTPTSGSQRIRKRRLCVKV